jgi:phosphate starvation-inducible membrane PsiE
MATDITLLEDVETKTYKVLESSAFFTLGVLLVNYLVTVGYSAPLLVVVSIGISVLFRLLRTYRYGKREARVEDRLVITERAIKNLYGGINVNFDSIRKNFAQLRADKPLEEISSI